MDEIETVLTDERLGGDTEQVGRWRTRPTDRAVTVKKQRRVPRSSDDRMLARIGLPQLFEQLLLLGHVADVADDPLHDRVVQMVR